MGTFVKSSKNARNVLKEPVRNDISILRSILKFIASYIAIVACVYKYAGFFKRQYFIISYRTKGPWDSCPGQGYVVAFSILEVVVELKCSRQNAPGKNALGHCP